MCSKHLEEGLVKSGHSVTVYLNESMNMSHGCFQENSWFDLIVFTRTPPKHTGTWHSLPIKFWVSDDFLKNMFSWQDSFVFFLLPGNLSISRFSSKMCSFLCNAFILFMTYSYPDSSRYNICAVWQRWKTNSILCINQIELFGPVCNRDLQISASKSPSLNSVTTMLSW